MTRALLNILITTALFFSVIGAHGQDFPSLHFTMQDGLPSNKVYSTYRDNKGFMWIATDKGVARYNGISFETFTTFDGLPDNEVFFFQEDHAGRLWLATYNGQLCYYKDDTFHTAANTRFLNLPFKAAFIQRIALEQDSSITIVFRKYPKFINIRHQKIKVIDLDTLRSCGVDTKIIEREKIAENRYRLTCTDEILDVDTSGVIISGSGMPVSDIVKEKPQSPMVSFTQNQDFIVTEHAIFTRNGQLVKRLNDTFRKKNLLYILYHNSLSYFFGTNNGIILNDNLRTLQGNAVSCITQDKQGNYWASTLDNGVFILDKDFMNTKLYKETYRGKIQYTRAFNDHLYFTTTDNNLFELAGAKVNPVFIYKGDEDPGLLNSRCFFIDDNTRYYFCNNKESIIIDNLLASPFKIRRFRSDLLPPNVFKAAIASANMLYINADSRVVDFDFTKTKAGELIRYNAVNDDLNDEKVFGMAKAPDNSVWYSTINNVFKVEEGHAVVQPQFRKTLLKFFNFFGDYMVGYTHYNKFIVCRNYNKAVVFDSLPNQNCIWDMFYKLDANHVLISTNNFYRLLTLDPLTVSVIENPFVPFQADAICSDDNNIYFFKNGSITSMELRRFLKPPDPPRLFFTSLRTDEKFYRVRKEIHIPYKESKNISIVFSTLSFSGKNVSCFYSVSKGEDNWQPITGDEINLVNPGAGYYTVKIKAKTLSSAYSVPIVFTLYVGRPYWASWWFITFCIWTCVALIGGIIRYRFFMVMRKRERVYQAEIKFVKSEYKAMNALMNPHFIFNTLNNVQSLVNANDKVAANEYLRIFADLIRQNMQNISKELIPLQKEIDLVANYLSLEKLRFEDKLTYAIDIDDDLDLSDIMVPPLLIQPLVENSIKHGILPLRSKAGFIKIRIHETDTALYIEVKDNGVGMGHDKSKENSLHESYGLDNIRKRIDQLGLMQNKKITFQISEIKDDADQQQWTVVTIIIPVTE